MEQKTRDFGLDILKGLACVLMILAHVNLPDPAYAIWSSVGGFGILYFLAATGATAMLQTRKYSLASIINVGVMLGLLGLSYKFMSVTFFGTSLSTPEILQIIALGTIAVAFLQKQFNPPPFVFLAAGLVVFLIKLAADPFVGQRFLGTAGLFFPPGTFPIFPWLCVFFLGAFAYQLDARRNFLLSALVLLVLGILALARVPLDLLNKWDMSVGYFLICCLLLFISFGLIKLGAQPDRIPGMRTLIFLGNYSLIFLYVQWGFVRLASATGLATRTPFVQLPFLVWIVVFACSSPAVWVLAAASRLRRLEQLFSQMGVWAILIAMIAFAPFLVTSDKHLYWVEFGLGTVFATFYRHLLTLVRNSENSRAGQTDGLAVTPPPR